MTVKQQLKGDPQGLTEGMVTNSYYPAYDDESNSWMKLFAKVNAEDNDDAAIDFNVVFGMSLARTRPASRSSTRSRRVASPVRRT